MSIFTLFHYLLRKEKEMYEVPFPKNVHKWELQ